MTYWYDVYRANLKMAVAQMLQYRFAILIWAVWGLVGPLISLAIWSAATGARSITNHATGASFGRADFAAYFLVFMIFGHLTMSWDAFEFAWRVRDGNLSPRLLKPLHPIHTDVAFNIAFKLTTSVMLLPVWILLFVLLKPTPPASGWSLLLAAPALVLVSAALLVVFLAENARIPVDDPNTHLELTMIHEVMILDHSGPDLAALQMAAALKMFTCAGILAAVLNPFGIETHPAAATVTSIALIAATGVGVGLVESLVARLRMSALPRYALVALLASVVSVGLVVLRGGNA